MVGMLSLFRSYDFLPCKWQDDPLRSRTFLFIDNKYLTMNNQIKLANSPRPQQMTQIIILLIVSLMIPTSIAQLVWAESNVSQSLLNEVFDGSIRGAFVGFYKESIYMVGDHDGNKGTSLIEFNVMTQSYTKHNNTFKFYHCQAQAYAQIDDTLYMTPWWDSYHPLTLSTFNFNTFAFNDSLPFPGETTWGRCLTSFKHFILIIGGNPLSGIKQRGDVVIYNTINHVWSTGPVLPSNRSQHSCNTVSNTIYVIGGLYGYNDDAVSKDDVWVLAINDADACCDGQWRRLTARLPKGIHDHRSVVFEDDIYIIGGEKDDPTFDGLNDIYQVASVYVLHTLIEEIETDTSMPYEFSVHSAITVGSIIYVWGGCCPAHPLYGTLPTVSPTPAPTFGPTIAPTYSPSGAPSNAPTRYPTSVTQYDKVLRIQYDIRNLFISNVNASTLADIIAIIEISYVNSEPKLEYRDFEITVDSVHTNSGHTLIMNASVVYSDEGFSDLFAFVSQDEGFVSDVEENLSNRFNSSVEFDAALIEETDDKPFDVVFYSLMALIAVLAFGSCIAFVFNKLPFTKVDDAVFIALLLTGIQIFDFVSDINLSREIVVEMRGNDMTLLYVAGVGSVVFIVVPYIANIILTLRIGSFIRHNQSASLYFQQWRGLFILLMICTGSAHSALTLLSSRLFGLDIFNSGLTLYELRQLSKLKLFGSILLENVPQLGVQILYVMYREGNPSQNTVLSFVASLLSIIAAVMSYILQRLASDCYVVQYKLEMRKKEKGVLTSDETNLILKRKECKKKWRQLVAAALNIQETAIEFGFVSLTNKGVTVNMIHYVFKTDLENNQQIKEFISGLYGDKKKKKGVNHAFSTHFGFTVKVSIDFVGQQVDEELMETEHALATEIELAEKDGLSNAGENAVNLLTKMDELYTQSKLNKHERKRKAIQRKLIREGYEQSVVESAIDTYSYFVNHD
eukprot:824244_1